MKNISHEIINDCLKIILKKLFVFITKYKNLLSLNFN